MKMYYHKKETTNMFYPVKVMDAEGNVKRIIEPDQLGDKYWKSFKKIGRRPFSHFKGAEKTLKSTKETFDAEV